VRGSSRHSISDWKQIDFDCRSVSQCVGRKGAIGGVSTSALVSEEG